MVGGTDKFKANSKYQQSHLVHNDYWEKGKTIQGHWIGKACVLYGVEEGSVVHADEFAALQANKHAVTGEKITTNKGHRKPFADLSIGAPKTWSLAAVNGQADLMREGHRHAVKKVITEMERLCGRQAHNGQEHAERTGKFCAAVYEHDTNRCLEAHLHTHVVIMNMTRSSNGKDYAQEFRELIDRSRYLTQVYNDALAAWAKAHGAEITFDEHGAPQLSALLDLKKISQQRTDQIEALIDQIEEHAGTKLTNREAKQIALASRGLDLEEFKRIWDAEKHELASLKGLDPERAERDRREILSQFTKHVWRASERALIETTAEEVRERQLSVFNAEQLERIATYRDTLCPVLTLEPDTGRKLEEDLAFAIEHLFARQSVVRDS